MKTRLLALFLMLTIAFNLLATSCSFPGEDESGGKNPGESGENGSENGENGSENGGNSGNEATPNEFADMRGDLERAIREALIKIDYSIPTFTDKFPANNSENNIYPAVENTSGWTTGFWPGILWHAYELTGDSKYKNIAEGHVGSFYYRIKDKVGVTTHDMGFLYMPSCVTAYNLDGNKQARDAALMAADHLITRYHEKSEFIQAWGSVGADDNFRLIIDCLMNLSLLYWASEETGDPKYRDIAYKHYKTTLEVSYRENGSTYHTYFFDKNTGEPLRGATYQGLNDESTWARGQAWGMYGPLITYKYTGDSSALETFIKTTDHYLANLPEDCIAYWDMTFTDGDEPRDSSAAAIALCAMLEGIKYMDKNDPKRAEYVDYCKKIMKSLIENYTTRSVPEANGLLLHGTFHRPNNAGVDEMTAWGDYFYMEALHRMLDPEWEIYW